MAQVQIFLNISASLQLLITRSLNGLTMTERTTPFHPNTVADGDWSTSASMSAYSRPPRDSMQVFVNLIFSHIQLFPNKQKKKIKRETHYKSSWTLFFFPADKTMLKRGRKSWLHSLSMCVKFISTHAHPLVHLSGITFGLEDKTKHT